MTLQLQSEPEQRESPQRRRRDRRWVLALVAAMMLVAVALAVFIARDDETTTTTRSTTPSTATSTASTQSIPSTSPSTSLPITVPTDTSTAVWPFAASDTRYATPEDAAKGFAVDFLGFIDPEVSPFMQGDPRSGEIEIRPNATGPVTTVFVRQLGQPGVDDSWWVLGAATNSIRIDTPAALERVTSPVHLSGTSTAFEAQVNVVIYADGQQAPLARTSVMGGSMGDFGPFSADVEFDAPHAAAGSVVMFTISMENGQTWEASVLRVHFAS